MGLKVWARSRWRRTPLSQSLALGSDRPGRPPTKWKAPRVSMSFEVANVRMRNQWLCHTSKNTHAHTHINIIYIYIYTYISHIYIYIYTYIHTYGYVYVIYKSAGIKLVLLKAKCVMKTICSSFADLISKSILGCSCGTVNCHSLWNFETIVYRKPSRCKKLFRQYPEVSVYRSTWYFWSNMLIHLLLDHSWFCLLMECSLSKWCLPRVSTVCMVDPLASLEGRLFPKTEVVGIKTLIKNIFQIACNSLSMFRLHFQRSSPSTAKWARPEQLRPRFGADVLTQNHFKALCGPMPPPALKSFWTMRWRLKKDRRRSRLWQHAASTPPKAYGERCEICT